MRFLIWSVELRRGVGWSLGWFFFLAGSFDRYWDSHHGIGALLLVFSVSPWFGSSYIIRIGPFIGSGKEGIQEIPLHTSEVALFGFFFIRDTTFLLNLLFETEKLVQIS